MLIAQPEEPEDTSTICHVHALPFGQLNETDLVDALLGNELLIISIIKVKDDTVSRHIDFRDIM